MTRARAGLILLAVLVLAAAADITAGRARLFEIDGRLGWRGIPGVVRHLVGPGGPWTVVIHPNGFRGQPVQERETSRELVILGDSFAFGEGVDLDERFDSWIAREHRDWLVTNRALSGFSPDQALLAGEDALARLKSGDAVLWVLFGDDLRGLLSERFAGRAKPRYRMSETGTLILEPPAIGPLEPLIERSSLLSYINKTLSPSEVRRGAVDEAAELFSKMAEMKLSPLVSRGVRVVLTLHGTGVLDADFGSGTAARVDAVLKELSQRVGFDYRPVDPALEGPAYHPDGDLHWNAAGHRRYFEGLSGVL